MTAILSESFDGIGTTRADYAGKWAKIPSAGLIQGSSGVHGNYFEGTGNPADTSFEHALTTAEQDDVVFVGAHWYFLDGFTTRPLYVALGDSGGVVHTHVRPTVNGQIQAARGGSISSGGGTALGSASDVVLQLNTWHFIEVKFKLHDSTGEVVAWVDGVQVLNLTNVDTKNAGSGAVYDRIAVNVTTGGTEDRRIDNIYILNEQGSSPLNTRLGTVLIDALDPNGNGNSSQFTGSDGNSTDNYLLVDEGTPDDDTTYVESGTDDHKDTYAFEDTTTNGSVAFVAQYARAKRTDTDSRDIALVARHSSSETTGADQALASTYGWHRQIYATNPSTAAAWTRAEVDAAEFGFKSRPT